MSVWFRARAVKWHRLPRFATLRVGQAESPDAPSYPTERELIVHKFEKIVRISGVPHECLLKGPPVRPGNPPWFMARHAVSLLHQRAAPGLPLHSRFAPKVGLPWVAGSARACTVAFAARFASGSIRQVHPQAARVTFRGAPECRFGESAPRTPGRPSRLRSNARILRTAAAKSGEARCIGFGLCSCISCLVV